MSQAEREKSKNRGVFSNLYVERIPPFFTEEHVLNLFKDFGDVLSVKVKRPDQNVRLLNPLSQPYTAYVNFKTQEQAQAAIDGLNGVSVIPGCKPLRVDFYQRANRFLGGFQGLDKRELIENTHFRVLFIKGLNKNVTREQLMEVCDKFGTIESITIKTKIEGGRVISKGIAIVQYSKKEEATLAIKKLQFHTELGDFLDIDFY